MVTTPRGGTGIQRAAFDGATFTIGAEATNAINVGIQLTRAGADVGERCAVPFYIAEDANGDTPETTAPTGGIAIGTDGALLEFTANLAGIAISEADGDIDITITDTGTPTFYLVLVMPDGSLAVSDAITFA